MSYFVILNILSIDRPSQSIQLTANNAFCNRTNYSIKYIKIKTYSIEIHQTDAKVKRELIGLTRAGIGWQCTCRGR